MLNQSIDQHSKLNKLVFTVLSLTLCGGGVTAGIHQQSRLGFMPNLAAGLGVK